MKKICSILAFFAILVSLTSCEHKDLCWEHYASLRINFDWTNAPDANPDNMRVYLYREDNSYYRIADLDPIKGGYITDVTPGVYHILCFNTTETAYERGVGSYLEQALTTSVSSLLEPLGYGSYSNIPRAAGTEDQDPHFATETIWGCSMLDVEVSENGVTYHEVFDDSVDYSTMPTVTESEITLYPRELSSLYTVEIRNVKNLKNVSQMSATLSGMAMYLNLLTGEPVGASEIIPFALSATDDTTIIGQFATFGTTYADRNQLVLYVWAKDGTGHAYGINDVDVLNVTDQVVNAENPKRVHIIIDGFTMPDINTVEGDSGFDTVIDDWETIITEITI